MNKLYAAILVIGMLTFLTLGHGGQLAPPKPLTPAATVPDMVGSVEHVQMSDGYFYPKAYEFSVDGSRWHPLPSAGTVYGRYWIRVRVGQLVVHVEEVQP